MENRYDGSCTVCDTPVPAGDGSVAKVEGKWRTYCTDHTIEDEPGRVAVSVSGSKVVARALGHLGPLFGVFRTAIQASGLHWVKGTDFNTGPVSSLSRLVVELDRAGIPVELSDGAKQALDSDRQAMHKDAGAADQRLESADADLAARGLALYPYQIEGVKWLATRSQALLADDMGLGKTAQALLAAPAGAPILVVCPAVAKGVWARECAKWRPDLRPEYLSGRGSFRWPAPGELVAINYDILPDETAAPPSGCVVIADEAHAVKNNKATRTKKFRSLSRAARRAGGRVWLLTATPLLNRPPELWAVLQGADLHKVVFGSWAGLETHFNATHTRWGTEWGDPSSEVPELLGRAMLRRIKTDVLTDLPAKRLEALTVNGLSAATRKLADKALQAAQEALEAASDPGAPMPDFTEISAARAALAKDKAKAAEALVDSYEDAGEPAVVFSAHRYPIDLLAAREGWAAITGDTPAAERSQIEADFQAGKLRGVAATIQAGGVAITLTRAAHAIFVDRLFTPALNAQAEDRIYRIGQSRGVVITDLVAAHPLDQRLHTILTAKAALVASTIDASAGLHTDQIADLDKAAEAAAKEIDLDGWAAKVAAAEARSAKIAENKETAAAVKYAARRAGGLDVETDYSTMQALERIAPQDARQKWIAGALDQLTALDPDRAQARNDAGWSAADGSLGRMLRDRVAGGLTRLEWDVAGALVGRYWRQVGRPPG